jgi:uncharacterized protein (TIRG00374 family)
VALEVGSALSLAQVYRTSVQGVGEKIPYLKSLRISMGTFAIGRILPGGGAASAVFAARQLVAAGFDGALATTAVVLAGALSMAVLGAVVSAGAVASLFRGDLPGIYLVIMSSVLGIFLAFIVLAYKALKSPAIRARALHAVERIARTLHLRMDLSEWRTSIEEIAAEPPDRKDLARIVIWSSANWLFDSAALWVIFLGLGYRMHVGVLLVGYGVANLVTALPLTPGGLGFVEAGLSGTYTAFGAPASIAVVAVLGYRLVSYWLPVLAGVPAYFGAIRRPVGRDAPESNQVKSSVSPTQLGRDD